MAIDYRVGSVHAEDSSNKAVVERVVHKDIRFMLYTTEDNAQWAANRAVRMGAVPLRECVVTINRFKYGIMVGALIKMTHARYGLTDVVFRVMNVKEESLASEEITLTLREDADYVSQQVVAPEQERFGTALDLTLSPLTDVMVIEAPYVLVGETFRIIPLVCRKKGTETGYALLMSTDGGSSFAQIKTVQSFSIHGVLVAPGLDESVNTLDKEMGFMVDFDLAAEALAINTILRSEMLSGKNLALITDGTNHEIVCFETATPVAGSLTQYKLTNLYRGRYDTIKRTWDADDDFYYIGQSPTIINNPNIYYGAERFFKAVPFNNRFVEDIADAMQTSITIAGRAHTPYISGNFRSNGLDDISIGGAVYQGTINLTWSPRIRASDAGINDPDSIVDASPTWEGYFEVQAFVSGVTLNISTAIDDDEITYTAASLSTWNGGTLPTAITFKLCNYIETNGITYRSLQRELIVTKV